MRTLRSDPIWRDRVLIALAYALAWGALLVNRGFYWDDWTLVGSSPGELVHRFWELGLPWGGYFYAVILATPMPGLVGHVLAFLAYLASTLILHAILRRVPGLSRMDALAAALTFALLPVNYGRVALIDLMYGLSLLAFLAATWLLLRHVEVGGIARRLAALLLFAFSFYTASLLVLYAVPIAVAALAALRSGTGIRPLARRYADFLVLPIAYWVLKALLFTPTGVYQGYNALSARELLRVPQAMLSIPAQVLIEPLARAASVAGIIGLLAGVAIAVWLARRPRTVEGAAPVPTWILFVAGVLVLVLGVFPYLAVGRVPEIWDWSSRHQLLVPIGTGLLAAAAVRGVTMLGPAGRMAGVAVVGLLLGMSAVADARTLVAYQVDWFKQQAIVETVRTLPEMAAARHIRVVDTATAFDALRRTYRFYEYNAIFETATGDERRLAALRGSEPDPAKIDLLIARPAYHMRGYVPSPVDLELRISPGERPGVLELLRLLGLEAVGSASFGPEVSKLIDIRATTIATPGAAP